MNLGELMNDESFIARMNFTIGRVYSLKQDYDTSIYFHEKHLNLARHLQDSIGQCRAYSILSQLNEKNNQLEKAKKYDSLYKALAREVIINSSFSSSFVISFRLMNQQKIQFQCQLDLVLHIICSKFVFIE